MNASNRNPRRRSQARPVAEALETRSLLTAGQGNTIAIMPVSIAQAGGSAEVSFTIDSTHFVKPKGSLTLGIDVAADEGSALNPNIASVTNGGSGRVPLSRGPRSSAVLATFRSISTTASYKAKVQAKGNTSGNALVGFYLPGDADGNGTVNGTDLQAVVGLLGSDVNSNNYSFDADGNRDGRITMVDVSLVRKNMGAVTTQSPLLSANLDAASAGADRVARSSPVKFTGMATPGAAISFAEVANRVPAVSTTADAAGNYTLQVPLAPGTNTFRVTSVDSFGQTISGQISPVTLSS
jgi:hypothetical protein